MIRRLACWCGLLVLGWSPVLAADARPSVPVALAWGAEGRLHVALRDARRIAVVDPDGWRIVGGWDVPVRPSSLAFGGDAKTLLVGGMDGELIVLEPGGRVVRMLPRGKGPTRVLPLPEGRAVIASTWDAAVRLVDWHQGRVLAVHALPFPPGAVVRAPDGRIIVADAFGGHLADLVPDKEGSVRAHSFDGVNLRALAISGDGKEVLVAHMMQYDTVPITNSNVDWGLVLSSRLSAVRLSDFDAALPPDSRLPRRRLTLDGSVHGAADPSAMAISPDGDLVFIALAGAHQVLKSNRRLGSPTSDSADLLPLGHNQRLEVVEVGRSPVALLLDPSGRFAVTADAMSDTLSVIRLADLAPVAKVQFGSNVVKTAAQRGEALFQDGRRSLDRWMSCASCHPAGHTNSLNFDTQGDGGYGAPKNTPSLLGVKGTTPFTWVGKFPRLGDQVHQSFLSSLRGPRPDPGIVDDLTAFLESLPPPPPRRATDDPAVKRGAEVFRVRRCDSCHRPPLYTIADLRDVGLDDEAGGHHRFNPPSLRGVSWSAPYLHDGRAETLDEVLEIHSPGSEDTALSRAERDDLIAFLESL